MGFFNKFKSNKEEAKKDIWTPLTEVSQLEEALELSKAQKVILFKHSTRCGISSSVISKFERQLGDNVKAYYLDLLNYRPISNTISEKFNIIHQSPQVVVLEGGKVVSDASHYEILDLNVN